MAHGIVQASIIVIPDIAAKAILWRLKLSCFCLNERVLWDVLGIIYVGITTQKVCVAKFIHRNGLTSVLKFRFHRDSCILNAHS